MYTQISTATLDDLWVVPTSGDPTPVPVLVTPFNELHGQFSPDGKWIAYTSNESGQEEIHVRSMAATGSTRVSTSGGSFARWRADGKELFYIALDGRLMAVPIGLAPNRQSLESGVPVPLFLTNIGGAIQGAYKQQYVVSGDGQRFLMNSVVTQATPSPVTVILNWQPKQ